LKYFALLGLLILPIFLFSNVHAEEYDIKELDSLALLVNGWDNELTQLDNGVSVLAFNDYLTGAYFRTYQVEANGTIIELDSLFDDETNFRYNSLAIVDSDTVILSYMVPTSSDGFLKTFDISSTGQITPQDTFNFDDDISGQNSIIQLDSGIFALIYDGGGSSIIKTFDVSNNGTTSLLETLTNETNNGVSY